MGIGVDPFLRHAELEEMLLIGVEVDDPVSLDPALRAGTREAHGVVSQPVFLLLASRRDVCSGEGSLEVPVAMGVRADPPGTSCRHRRPCGS
jgi:hypothetical protein